MRRRLAGRKPMLRTKANGGNNLDVTCINTIRALSMDAVQTANSAHPGTPMALAPVERRKGLLAVRMTLPPAGFAIYQAAPGLNRLDPNPPPDLKPWQPRAADE